MHITPDDIQGSISDNAVITIFDGTALKNVPVSNGKFTEAHGITPGYYGVLFFTKEGSYPETILFKAQDRSMKGDSVSLKSLKDAGKGVLTGVVYKPVTGGKLREHKGIFQTFKGEKIHLVKDSVSRETTTDDKGIFMIELLPGEYEIVFNGRNAGKALIEKGKTTVKNIQKGVVLKD
ncbi:MAG: hypothetical protein HZA14_01825 [Nitrospirae bacterium]|nr:hypothetical protein [Nitrospirota bacterium]